MTEKEKTKILEDNGWHHYYSSAWVHKDIFRMLEKRGKFFYCPDYTGWQLETDEAYEYQIKYNS